MLSSAIAFSSAGSRRGWAGRSSRSDARSVESGVRELMAEQLSVAAPALQPASGPAPQRDSGAADRNPYAWPVTAEAPRPSPGDRDLAAAGIGLLASPTE